jgi:mono/diheme cytochrome c family protein
MKLLSMISGALLLLLTTAGCEHAETAQAAVESPPAPAVDAAERGRYLVTVAGCNGCHTPFRKGSAGPEPDMSRMLAGHPQELAMPAAPKTRGPWVWAGAATNTAFAGPWGVSYASNLTPEANTGLGIWTEDLFVKALRTGRHWGQARPILPPMPWQNYAQMTDEDLKAIYAYLRTIPPVVNSVPESMAAAPPS